MSLPVIELIKGNTFLYDVIVEISGAGIDVTDWLFSLAITRNLGDSESDAVIALENGDFDRTAAGSGLVAIRIEPAETAGMPPGLYYIEVKSKDTDGVVTSLQAALVLKETANISAL